MSDLHESWESPDLHDIHFDLEKLRSYELGSDRWMELMRGALDLVRAADVQLAVEERQRRERTS